MKDSFAAAYALDGPPDRMVLARAERRGDARVVLASACSSDAMREEKQRISRQVDQGRAAAVVCAPAAQTVVRRLVAPFASIRKADRIWPSLLDVELPFPVECAQTFYAPAWVENGRAVTWACALRRQDLEANLALWTQRGWPPTHCDVEALALWAGHVAETPAARPDVPVLLIWLGADHVTLVRGRGAEFSAAHVLRAAPAEWTDAAWAARLQPVLAAHAVETDAAVFNVWWAGPGVEQAGLVPRLQNAMPFPGALRHEIHRQAAAFLALSLARRALAGDGVNFLEGAGAHPAIVRKRSRRRQWAYWGVLVASLLVLLLNQLIYALRREERRWMDEQLMETTRRLTGEPALHGLEMVQAERAIPRRDEETRAFRHAADSVGLEGQWLALLPVFSRPEMEVARFSLQPGRLQVHGTVQDIRLLEDVGEQLRALGWTLHMEAPGLSPEGRPQFVLKGTSREE
ncbi:MAG: hypothetical protein LBN38_02990 [Verrucomicrobiota bacterium]|jgi:hypothetical protein|nr:hypothetical protein [Verrucomicrobiota bacterium]